MLRRPFISALVVVVVGVGIFSLWGSNQGWSVGFDDDEVVLYQGRPDKWLWVGPTQVEGFDIDVELLDARDLTRLDSKVHFDTEAEARRYIENLESRAEVNGATEPETETEPESEAGGTIVDVVATGASYSLFDVALEFSDLAATLSGPGNFTVFAPNDDALIYALDSDRFLDSDPVLAIEKYHVVAVDLNLDDLLAAANTCIETIDGAQLRVAVSGDYLTIGGVAIISGDVEASNGIVHLVDSVIAEPSTDC